MRSKVILGVVVLLISGVVALSQVRPTTRRYNPKCRALQLGGNDQALLERLAESLGKRYQLRLVPWSENAPGQRQFDLVAPGENPTDSNHLGFAFGDNRDKVRGNFVATQAGPSIILSNWFGPITIVEPKRTWLLAAAKITVSHYTGLDEDSVGPELEKLLKSAEDLNLTEADLKRMGSGKFNPPVFEKDFGQYTMTASRLFSSNGFSIYRYACRS